MGLRRVSALVSVLQTDCSCLNAPVALGKVRVRVAPFPAAPRRGSRCSRTGMAPEVPGSRRICPSNEEGKLMRRASTCLAVLGLAFLALPGIASALPTVTFKAETKPTPGSPHTGNPLGAGTPPKAEYKTSGREYDNSPPP